MDNFLVARWAVQNTDGGHLCADGWGLAGDALTYDTEAEAREALLGAPAARGAFVVRLSRYESPLP